MTQDEINAAEWSNPNNWSDPKWIGFYFSKKDTRAWVPKAVPAMGWTVNLAHAKGVFSILGIIAAAVLLASIAGYLAAATSL